MSEQSVDRRTFLKKSSTFVAATATLSFYESVLSQSKQGYSAKTITLPELGYAENALEPTISAKTISFHYGKHHQAYVEKLNSLIASTEYAKMPLEEIIKKTVGIADKAAIFNNAAQVWNHTFYWRSMKPKGGGIPTGKIAEHITMHFGSFDSFKTKLIDTGLAQFGSGWVWLVSDGSGLQIQKTANADTVLTQNVKPLLTIDVWEHAYYLDYQNKRKDYLQKVIENSLNWDFANTNLS